MSETTLKIEERNEIGGSKARRLLKRDLIPAVVYGNGMKSTAALVDGSEMRKLLKKNGRNTIFHVEFAEEQNLSMLIKNIQYNPVSGEMIHLDFQKVNPEEKVHVNIPVKVIGSEGLKSKGNTIIHQLDSITVECLPRDIPRHADADISSLNPGYSFTAEDFKFPSGVSLISKPNKVVLTIKGHEIEKEADSLTMP